MSVIKIYEKCWRSNSGKTAYKEMYASRNGKKFVKLDDYPAKTAVRNTLPREKNAVKREVKLPENEHIFCVHSGNLAVLEKAPKGINNYSEAWKYLEEYDPEEEREKAIKKEEEEELSLKKRVLEIANELKNKKLVQDFVPDAKFHFVICRNWDGDQIIFISDEERVRFDVGCNFYSHEIGKDLNKMITPIFEKMDVQNFIEDDMSMMSDEILEGKDLYQKKWWSFVDSNSTSNEILDFIEKKKVDITMCQFERSDHKLVKGMSENAFANLYFISDRKTKAKYESDMVETMYVQFGSFEFILDWNLGNPKLLSEESETAHRLREALSESNQIWLNIKIINENLIFVDDLDNTKKVLSDEKLCEKHCFSII